MVGVGFVARLWWPQAAGVALAVIVCKRVLGGKGEQAPAQEDAPAEAKEPAVALANATEQDLADVPVEVLTEDDQPAEAPGDEFKEIAACELPCSVQDFFALVLSTRSSILQDCHRGAGHFDIVKAPWETQEGSNSLSRDMFFVTPVKGPVGPKQTRVIQRHTVSLHPGSTLLYRVTQQNLDIPFKDCFSVGFLWVAAPAPGGGCRVAMHLAVPFTRWCAFKGLIISTTFKDCTVFCSALLQHVQKVVPLAALPPAVGIPAGRPAAGAASPEGKPSPSPPPAPWDATLAGGRPNAAAALAVVCCGLQLWVLSQAWAAGCPAALVACPRPDARGAAGPLVDWQPVAGAGAAVVSLLLCLLQMRG